MVTWIDALAWQKITMPRCYNLVDIHCTQNPCEKQAQSSCPISPPPSHSFGMHHTWLGRQGSRKIGKKEGSCEGGGGGDPETERPIEENRRRPTYFRLFLFAFLLLLLHPVRLTGDDDERPAAAHYYSIRTTTGPSSNPPPLPTFGVGSSSSPSSLHLSRTHTPLSSIGALAAATAAAAV